MKKQIKRLVALALAGAIMLCLAACGGGNDVSEETLANPNAGEGKVFTEPTELDLIISSHASWPYNENWAVWKYISEKSGANLNITTLPSTDISTKLPLMMANPAELPDLLHTYLKSTVDNYAMTGAYMAYDDYADLLPNMNAFIRDIPEESRADVLAMRTAADGKMYYAPAYGTHTVNNLRSWMYRKDIFEKHGLEVPATTDELYEVAKKLKELYPDSYPICFRDGFYKLEEWGPSWEPYLSYSVYYDYNSNEWKHGVQQPILKEMVEFFRMLREEDLIPPDFTSMPTKSWEELMSTDRGFITLDYIVRIDFFNVPNREENPDYTLALMAPPKPDTPQGNHGLYKGNLDFSGYAVCNTGREQDIENAFKFVDWLYTDEAIDLVSWGKEGETYEVVDGKKRHLVGEGEDSKNKFGFGTYGTYQVLHTEANEALYTEEQVEACHGVLEYLMPRANPNTWLPFTQDQKNEMQNMSSDIITYVREGLDKFMLGQSPMSEWDAFVAGLDDLNVNRLLEIYSQAYDNATQGK